jgi:hypothetical protein
VRRASAYAQRALGTRVDRYVEARETADRHKSRAHYVYLDEDGM